MNMRNDSIHQVTDRASSASPGLFRARAARPLSVLGAALVFVMALLAGPGSAKAWWNDEWTLRKKIAIDTSSTGSNITETIGSIPVLVRLHVGNFRFANAKADGSDLRFVAGDDKTPLKFHFEKYDSLAGEALVWVAMPTLQPGAKTDIWLYYGNKKATAGADPKATYGSDVALVYHFTERATPALDMTVWTNNARSAGQPADGALIGTGLRSDGTNPVSIPGATSLAFAQDGPLTISAWVKPAAMQRNAVLYSRRDGANALLIGFDDGAPFFEVTSNGTTQRSAGASPVAPGGWHHIALVATSGLVTLYLDGATYASLAVSIPGLNSAATLGADTEVAAPPPPAAPPAAPAADQSGSPTEAAEPPAPAAPAAVALPGFAGEIDEFSITKAARPAGYIRASALNQGTDPSRFIGFSVDEETSSWLSGYFIVILKSVTTDGWVVIGILLIMSIASVMVMVEKNSYLSRQFKANARFLDEFRELTDDLTALAVDEEPAGKKGSKANPWRHSSLHHIYRVGAGEIQRRFAGRHAAGHVLTAEAIAAIRAALDARLVRELQQLNRMMVILTIAISGGPFLGLLGTVIGVMVTFAAIAMSGDVNINAIAPGVAGALMATVAGLGVAIPSLFGYNYLSVRIRDLSSDMQVFVDEFTTKMAEAYGAGRPNPVNERIAAE